MTIYAEDPRKAWYAHYHVQRILARPPAKDHSGRGQTWLELTIALALFWSAVAYGLYLAL